MKTITTSAGLTVPATATDSHGKSFDLTPLEIQASLLAHPGYDEELELAVEVESGILPYDAWVDRLGRTDNTTPAAFIARANRQKINKQAQ